MVLGASEVCAVVFGVMFCCVYEGCCRSVLVCCVVCCVLCVLCVCAVCCVLCGVVCGVLVYCSVLL